MFEQRLSLLMAARPTLGFPALAPVVICMYDVYVGVFVTEIIYMYCPYVHFAAAK